MKRVLKDSGLIYIHCDCAISHYIKIILDKVFGIKNFRNEIIWHYNSAPRKKKDFGKRHDTIFRYSKTDNYFFNADSSYIRQDYSKTAPRGYEKEKYYDPRGKILDDVWKINMIGQNDKTERVGYATQKPLSLMYPIIDSSCPSSGLVADFFLGSGTFVVAAKMLGRNYIGCDISEKSIKISKERLNSVK
jgi:site-specific DNA-methyltransferase (adenine-specific)